MPNRIIPPLSSRSREQSRELRRQMTDAEQRLWLHLRAGRLGGLKFRRQHPFAPYILDFYCAEHRLVIELDGSQHDEHSDARRTALLQSRGLQVLRFWDNDVLTNTDAVLEAILNAVADRTLTPTPLPQGEGF